MKTLSMNELKEKTTSLLSVESLHMDVNQPTCDVKVTLVKKSLQKIHQKFSNIIDKGLYKELDRIIANLEITFISHRSINHLIKLAYSIYFIRRKLSKNIAFFPHNHHLDIRVFPSSLYFTFHSKPVLSILAHAHLKDKYELFDEDQIIFIIQKLIKEIQLVKSSVYFFLSPQSTIKTLYFEINKKNGLTFSPEEIKHLKRSLRQEMKFSVKRLAHPIFMIRNEEEVLKNILILSREIDLITDLPQVMILFDEQTLHEAIFTIILVRVLKPNQSNLKEYFNKIKTKENLEYLPERSQIVKYLRKKHPIEANVFRIRLTKDSSLIRIDMSLNFYLARQRISHILTEAVGEFRDYNGGIIFKQREMLASFRNAFHEVSAKDPDLLENFYYSLTPIEVQAILSFESLKILFELFLEAKNFNFTKPSDFFLQFQRNQDKLYILIRMPEEDSNEIDAIFSSFETIQKTASFSIPMQNTCCLGYFLENIDEQTKKQLSESIHSFLENWKGKIENLQVLKLCLEHPIVSLDPRIGGDETSAFMLKMLFEGLMRTNRLGELEKGMAKYIEISSDQKTYVFILRPTLWSDGSPVSAYDFEYAWKKVLSPSFKTPFAYLFYPIKNAKLAKNGSSSINTIGVKALDNFTLKVELEFPSPYFLELTAHTIYSPVNRFIDQKHPNWSFEDGNFYICNGAFQLKKNDHNGKYELTKNHFYWDVANIKLDGIEVLKTNRYHCYEMFQKDMNHWIGTPLVTWDPSFVSHKNENDERVVAFLGNTVFWFVFNTQCFPFNHKKIRQAFSLGINRSKLKGNANVPLALSPIPSKHSQVNDSILSKYSLEKAQELFHEALEELDMSFQDFPIISLIHLTGSIRQSIAYFIKEEWERAFGIRCNLESLEWKVLFSKMTNGDFQVGGMTWSSWINDPIYTLNAFRNANEPINFPKWENKEYQEIMKLAERETDPAKRKSYYLQAEKILLEEMPVAPIYQTEAPAFKKKNFHVQHFSPLINFKWSYFS